MKNALIAAIVAAIVASGAAAAAITRTAVSGLVQVSVTKTVPQDPDGIDTVAAPCPAGKHATGGGFGLTPGTTAAGDGFSEGPMAKMAGWRVTITHNQSGPVSVTVYAVCAL